jgi:hypothetical protein
MKKYAFIFLSFLLSVPAFAQSTKYRNYKYDWGKAKPKVIPVNSQFSSEDAVILEEKNIIRIDKNNFFFIEKYMRIKLLTAKGAQQLSKITLPESFDPQYDYRELPFGNSDRSRKHWYYDMSVTFFAARTIKSDGSVKELEVKDRIIAGKQFTGKTYYNNYVYEFDLGGQQANDELEIRYKYVVPSGDYFSGSSERFFFHGPYPKQDHNLSITYDKDLRYYFFVQNGASPIDTTIADPADPEVGLAWHSENLFAIKNEPGALLHKDLPYVRFYRHYNDYGVRSKKDPRLMVKVLPYTWHYFSDKLRSYRKDADDAMLTHTDKNTLGLKKLYESSLEGLADTSAAMRFGKVHSVISNDFDFVSYYTRYKQDNYLYGPGEAAATKVLYEQDRYSVYFKLLQRTGRMYYLAIVPDKRIEEIDFGNFFPPLAAQRVFCLTMGKDIFYYFPKFARFGYETNELPFYLENVKTVLVPRNMDEIFKHRLNEPQPKFLLSPNSDESSNTRSVTAQVNVSTAASSASVDARISLTGQFSTMTRPAYLYNLSDSSANPKYGLRIFDTGKNIKLLQNELSSRSAVFPFKTTFKVKYEAESALIKNEDETLSVDLTGWFHHIIYDDFSAASRKLTFYPDFKMSDTFRYRIKFDRKVSMLNAAEYEGKTENAFGKYSLRFTQVSGDEIEVESSFIVKADQVPASETGQVEDIYKRIEKLNKGVLKVKVE